MLGIEFRRRTVAWGGFFEIVPPEVASLLPANFFIGAANDDGFFDGGAIFEGGVRNFFQGNNFAAAVATIGCDQDFRFCVADAIGKRCGAETAENYRMHRPDARAAQHCNHQLWNHRHVDGDAIAGLYVEREEHVGETADAGVKFGVGELERGAVFSFPEKRRLVGIFFEMAIEAVVRDVELAAGKPFGMRRIPFESVRRLLEPVKQLGLLGPECLGIFGGASIHRAVFLEGFDVCMLGEICRRGDSFFVEHVRIEFQHGSSQGIAKHAGAARRHRSGIATTYVIEPWGVGQEGERAGDEMASAKIRELFARPGGICNEE